MTASAEECGLTPRVEWVLVILLVALGGVLRFYNLEGSPPGFFRDEAEKGYTAWELFHTGRHGVLGPEGVEVSRLLPLFIEVYSGHDRTSAIYQYVAAPFVGIGGLSVASTRFPAALAGLLSVVLAWGFARRMMGPLAAAVVLAMMALHPGGIVFSRWAQQGIFVILFALGGFWALFEVEKAAGKHRRALGALGAVLLCLAAYSYDPARLVIPLVAAAFLATRSRAVLAEGRTSYFIAVAILVLGIVPLIVYTLGAGSARLDRVGVFSGGVLEGVRLAASNYLSHFTPGFLAWSGDANPRHQLPGGGLIGLGCTALLLAGVVSVFVTLKRGSEGCRNGAFLLAWFLLAPVAAALTREGIPHALRANLMIPGSTLLAGWGASWLCAGLGRRFIIVACVSLALLQGGQALWGSARLATERPNAWESGVLTSVERALDAPGRVYLSSAIPYASFFALFAERTDPAEYQENGLGALRMELLAPGETPRMEPGDAFVGPPQPGLPMEFMGDLAIVYFQEDQGVQLWRKEEGTEWVRD